jgi:hypothetical protein
MTPGRSVKNVFGLGPLSSANAAGMLPMLRAASAARIANFMVSLLVPIPKAGLPAEPCRLGGEMRIPVNMNGQSVPS